MGRFGWTILHPAGSHQNWAEKFPQMTQILQMKQIAYSVGVFDIKKVPAVHQNSGDLYIFFGDFFTRHSQPAAHR